MFCLTGRGQLHGIFGVPAPFIIVSESKLFTDNALKWEPGTVKCVSVDALPAQLDYLRSGHVQVLLAQQVFEWGHRSVEHLINKVHLKKDPAQARDVSLLVRVTKDNVDEFEKNWEKWLPK